MITKSPNSLPKHNSTLDKQGGDSTSNDYYHLTEEEVTTIHNTSGINTGDQTSSDFDHNSLQNTHNLTTDIDHNTISNLQGGDSTSNDYYHLTSTELSVIQNTSGINTGDQTSSDFDHNSLQNTHNLTSDIDHNTISNTHNLTTDINHNLLDNLQGGDSTSSEYYHLSEEEVITVQNTSGVNTGDQTSSDFDHNSLQNTHNLTTDINHNLLNNLQGGDSTSEEYYHLNNDDYNNLTNGSPEFSDITLTTGAGSGKILTSDSQGNASWGTLTTINQYSITVESPTASEDICMGFTFVAITITKLEAVIVGTGTPSCTINPSHGTDRSAATNTILTAATAVTNTTTGVELSGSFNDVTIPANSWIVLKTTASTTCTQLTITMKYTID